MIPIRPDEPLGPLNYQYLQDSRALSLVDIHDPFISALRTEPRLIVGRKGSGKSTVLYANQFFDELRPRLKRHNIISANNLSSRTRHVIVIKTHREFEPIVDSVYNNLYGGGSATYTKTTETICEEWEDRLWFQIYSYFYSCHIAEPSTFSRSMLFNTIALCDRNFMNRVLDEKCNENSSSEDIERIFLEIRDGSRAEIIDLLKKGNLKCYLLIDSLEEYPVYEDRWLHVVRGFLPALELMQRKYSPYIHIIATLPEEIESSFRNLKGSEPGKSFSSMYRLRWRPRELKRILAHRFSCLIREIMDDESLIHAHYADYNRKTFERLESDILSIDFSSPSANRKINLFFERVLPSEVKNKIGNRENVWSYIFRHTHMCPRHLLSIFTNMVVNSGEYWRSNGKIPEGAVVWGVGNADEYNSSQVVVPYQSIYPDIQDLVQRFCRSLTPFFGYKDLARMAKVLGKQLVNPTNGQTLSVEEACVLLYNIGVIGRVEGGEMGRAYVPARYYFCRDGVPDFNNNYEYCLHPVFSGSSEARNRAKSDSRVAYPVDVEFE